MAMRWRGVALIVTSSACPHRGWRRVVGPVLLTLSASACLFPSLATLTSPSDGGTTDATYDVQHESGADTSAMDAGIEASNVIWSDDFETDCSGWYPQYGTVMPTSTAHTGNSACLVCSTASGPYFTLDHGTLAFAPIEAGLTYTGRVWVRAAPQTTNPNLLTVVVVRTVDSMGSFLQQGAYNESPVGQSWLQVSSTLTVDGGAGITGYVGLDNYNVGDCFIVDDFTLEQNP